MVVDHKVNALEVHCLKHVVLSPYDEAHLVAAAAVELTLAAAHTPQVDTPLLGRKVRTRPELLMVNAVPMIYGDAVAVAASWLWRLLLIDGNVGEETKVDDTAVNAAESLSSPDDVGTLMSCGRSRCTLMIRHGGYCIP